MGTIKLTDKYILSVSAPKGKRLELFDEQVSGLVLRVTDRGRKSWVVRYWTTDGRHPRYTLGTYPALGLKDARAEALKIIVQGKELNDPASERRKQRIKFQSRTINTFDDLAQEYLAACENGSWQPKNKKKRTRTLDGEKAVYRLHVKPTLGAMRLEDITRKLVKSVLRDMVACNIHSQTNQAQAFVRQTFAYAITEYEGELVNFNPATGFPKMGKVNPRTRTLNDAEIRLFWKLASSPPKVGDRTSFGQVIDISFERAMGIALQLGLLLLPRASELAGMALSELDLENGIWLIPGERMKGGWPHLVPLAPASVTLIKEALKLRTDKKSPFVFPSPRDSERPVLGSSIYHAMVKLVDFAGISSATPHDLRRTGSTIMTSERLGIMPFIRSKVLGHRGDTGGGAAVSMLHYDANEYVSEKRRALTAWSDLVHKIVDTRDVADASPAIVMRRRLRRSSTKCARAA